MSLSVQHFWDVWVLLRKRCLGLQDVFLGCPKKNIISWWKPSSISTTITWSRVLWAEEWRDSWVLPSCNRLLDVSRKHLMHPHAQQCTPLVVIDGSEYPPPKKKNMAMENQPFMKMYFLLNMGIFQLAIILSTGWDDLRHQSLHASHGTYNMKMCWRATLCIHWNLFGFTRRSCVWHNFFSSHLNWQSIWPEEKMLMWKCKGKICS